MAYAPPNDPEGGKKFVPASLFLSLRDPCGAYAIRPYCLTDDFFVSASSFLSLRDPCGAYAIRSYCLTDDFFIPVSLFLSFLPENLLETTSPAGRL